MEPHDHAHLADDPSAWLGRLADAGAPTALDPLAESVGWWIWLVSPWCLR